MRLAVQTIGVLTVLFSVAGPITATAQTIRCNGKLAKIKNFRSDTVYTFENQFVKSGKINNIRNSEMPFEFRIYVVNAFFPKAAKIISLKGDGNTLIGSLANILIVERRRARPEDMITKDSLSAVVTLSPTKEKTFNCDLIDTLINKELFTMSPSKQGEFKKNDKYIMDSQFEYIYEIKVGNHFRNFRYVYNPNFVDQVPNREKKVLSLINYFFENLKK